MLGKIPKCYSLSPFMIQLTIYLRCISIIIDPFCLWECRAWWVEFGGLFMDGSVEVGGFVGWLVGRLVGRLVDWVDW